MKIIENISGSQGRWRWTKNKTFHDFNNKPSERMTIGLTKIWLYDKTISQKIFDEAEWKITAKFARIFLKILENIWGSQRRIRLAKKADIQYFKQQLFGMRDLWIDKNMIGWQNP